MITTYKDLLNFLKTLDERPKLLLHSCCAPCSSHVLFLLKKYFDITIFFSNDNIYPKKEYFKRLDEIKRFCENIDSSIKVIQDDYKEEDFIQAIKGYEHLGEKSLRCYNCYKLRLEKTAKYAKEENFDYFTTTLSISPHKKDEWINEIGFLLEKKYNIAYLYSNFKKDSGYQHSIELSKKYGLYRQDYCGCIYSYQERKRVVNGFTEEDKN